MSEIKKLAGQTVWYGGSTIAAKFINYLLTPYLTYTLDQTADFGKMGIIYSAIPIFNIIFTYGFETAYFRFASKPEYRNTIYNTASLSLFFSTIVLTILLWFNQSILAGITGLAAFPKIIQYSIIVIALDAFTSIPFARLREQGRPKKFAFVRIAGILVNIFFTWFFISYCPNHLKHDPHSWVGFIYDPKTNPIVYVVLANVIQSAVTLVLLSREILEVRFNFDWKLWKEMMVYALPLLIVGMGGMINETFDRLMLRWWLPGKIEFREQQVGIYNACYKLSILITLFIQAFKMGAEPFFFKQAEGANPQKIYARVMKFFIIIISVMFLAVTLFMPIWKNFIGPKYWAGLSVVPILLLANMFLGIYYNLSVWYKLSNKTLSGAYITLFGAVLTCVLNYIFIPKYSYIACAWTTFFCYGSMMLISYKWGQKEYRIPYAWKKLVAYMVIAVAFYFIHWGIISLNKNVYLNLLSGAALLAIYCWFIATVERKELERLPAVGKFFTGTK
ncbi:MAG: oligosaccharide flippase family protein [Ferruginibacter sp.]